jgi:hypothetical protein
MRERWSIDEVDDGKTLHYILVKERQIWRFYLRVLKKWFTPCAKCQEMIDVMWNSLGLSWDAKTIQNFPENVAKELCPDCLKEPREMLEYSEVILGNKDYDPPIELSRKWEPDGIDPEVVTIPSYAEYVAIKRQFGEHINNPNDCLILKKELERRNCERQKNVKKSCSSLPKGFNLKKDWTPTETRLVGNP